VDWDREIGSVAWCLLEKKVPALLIPLPKGFDAFGGRLSAARGAKRSGRNASGFLASDLGVAV
jgi:hypothetical protein